MALLEEKNKPRAKIYISETAKEIIALLLLFVYFLSPLINAKMELCISLHIKCMRKRNKMRFQISNLTAQMLYIQVSILGTVPHFEVVSLKQIKAIR